MNEDYTPAEKLAIKRSELDQLSADFNNLDEEGKKKHEKLAAEVAQMEDELKKEQASGD